MLTLNKDQLMIEHYKAICRAQNDEVEVHMENYDLIIEGENLFMMAMTKDEILLKGTIHCVRIKEHETSIRS